MLAFHPMEIVDRLGNRRLITRRYGDGSFDCPHCSYPVVAPALECAHPWCPAHPEMPIGAAESIVLKREADAAERERVRRNIRLARERIKAEAIERKAAWDKVRHVVAERGACLRCAARSFGTGGLGTKIVRHRKPCPLEVRP